jgi:hypothetical protein
MGAEPNGLTHFNVTAQHICELHLPRRAAFRREEPGTPDHNTRAARTRSGDIKTVEIVEKLMPLGASSGVEVSSRRLRPPLLAPEICQPFRFFRQAADL